MFSKYRGISKTTALRKIKGNRGSIFDINGNLLAYSIEKCRFWVNTKQANNIEEITNFFETKFKDKNKVNYNFKNTKSTYSLIVQDLVSYENQKIIEDSKSIKNLNYSLYKHRLYPYNELAAQVIGFTNNGILLSLLFLLGYCLIFGIYRESIKTNKGLFYRIKNNFLNK